jgi:hypothetical protein
LPKGDIQANSLVLDELIYYFMDFVPGSPCEDPIWKGGLSRTRTSQVIRDFAITNVRRCVHPLRLVGSLHLDPSTQQISVGPGYTARIRRDCDIPVVPGPWRTASKRYRWQLGYDLTLIKSGQLYGSKRDIAFLIWKWLRQVIPLYPPICLKMKLLFYMRMRTVGILWWMRG